MRSLAIITLAALAVAPAGAGAAPKACPPGLAKKSPACIPPGQARHYGPEARPYVGQRITGDYRRLTDPRRYGLDPRRTYFVRGDGRVVRVDPETQEILDLIGAIHAIID
ncbi:hypothetical protein Ga0609869_003559 [Rhodovulum iodosum]|uniref:Excinuclease ABC subunit A n=1 Tax=Rhodovulum iodosum TaxID=68291 RepID=A0ABV3XXV3_9RHOB|nr:excinuclease ABC subunit A [Rhodovulum robiginosum]RSK38178.1 excinuclease ABC subunit A [Rhodovulum robiginosum]